MKVLFIGAGKRLEMASKFIKANWSIDAYEYDVDCPLNLLNITIIKGKKWKDPETYKEISLLCKNYDLVLPFQDEATELLSRIKEEQKENDQICVSELAASQSCLNKQLFATVFYDQPFYPKPIVDYPAVIKPINGFGSKGIKYVQNWNGEQYQNHVIQRKIENGFEYSVDCYFDKSSNLIDFVPRIRTQISSGEVIKSSTISKNKFDFENIINLIASKLKFCGPICIQFISDEKNNIWIMEINARFGGGCTLSIESGLNMIELLKTEYVDLQPIKNYESKWKSDLHMSRCFVDYYYETNSI